MRRHRRSGYKPHFSDTALYKELQDNLTRIETDFGQSDDLAVNCFQWTSNPSSAFACIYIETLVDKNAVNHLSKEFITIKNNPDQGTYDLFELMRRHFSTICGLKTGCKFMDLYAQLLSGNTVILANGNAEYLSIPTESTDSRSIESRLPKLLSASRKRVSANGST